MNSTTKQLIVWLHNLRTQAAKGDLTSDAIAKNRVITDAIIKSSENLNFAISAAKICPKAVDIPALTNACRNHAPAWIDSLLAVEGVDKSAIQSDIIRRQHPYDALSRILAWYPEGGHLPVEMQRQWAEQVHNLCKRETTTGTAYQRRLTNETSSALIQGISYLGDKITDNSAATWLLRASHYVLRAMTRTVPILHALPEDFAENTLESLWSYAMSQSENRDEWRINAQVFTLANTEAFLDARTWLSMHYPNESAIVNKLWDKPALQVTNHFAAERRKFGISSTIVQREGDWTPPRTNVSATKSNSYSTSPSLG